MMEKGYVVCLLKYILGSGQDGSGNWDALSENKRPVSLGYFGRVDAVPVEQFRDYMDIASTRNAGFTGSRKQLLLYPLDYPVSSQIRFQKFDETDTELLPFQPVTDRRPCFCCLSILNIDHTIKQKVCGAHYSSGIRKIAAQLSVQIDACVQEDGDDAWLPYAVMGLLGTEDICVIFLSDSFDMISKAINRLRRLESEDGVRVLDNSHSIMAVDFSERAETPKWGNTMAELHFSLKGAGGLKYLRDVKQAIADRFPNQNVVLESRIGEYDATIRCPAALLGDYLYGYSQMLNYGTAQYRNAAYQSETILFQDIDGADEPPIPVPLESTAEDRDPPFGEVFAGKLAGPIKDTIENVCQYLEDPTDTKSDRSNANSSYVSQVLYRLLKDFMRTVSIPVGGTFQHDLSIQFQVAINAILHIAQKYAEERKYNSQAQREFDKNFSKIVEAISKSMQAASQIDRFCFEEQQSHLQNTGAYHKVLLAYYGIVKAILELVYTIPRNKTSRQAVLIPLLSFGHTQIICSNSINSFYQDAPDSKPVHARLICITLPYQALSSIPKYIGPLAHEIFHYSTPANRERRNAEAGKCLTAVAFRCFLDQAAAHLSGQFGINVFNQYRDEFLATVDEIFGNIQRSLEEDYRAHTKGHTLDARYGEQTISSDAFFLAVKLALTPSFSEKLGNTVMELYLEGWAALRTQLQSRKGVDQTTTDAFQLDKNWNEEETRKYIGRIYRDCCGKMSGKIAAFLSAYETFLREIPPDLFDIGCVMLETPADVKARQYLWQIHSIRSDKLYYNGQLSGGKASNVIDGNSFRFGAVLDYLIFGSFDVKAIETFSTRRGRIETKLKEWYSGDNQAQERKKNCEAITLDYEKYCTESLFANLLMRDYIDRVDWQISNLVGSSKAKEIMKRLSAFYQEYYQIFDGEDEKGQISILFDLTIRIIEFYQCQPGLSSLCHMCSNAPVLRETKAEIPPVPLNAYASHECETMVFDPSGLSGAVTRVYETMCPYGHMTPLWFRGHAERDWLLLPNIMRPIEHKDGDKSIDSDGFLPGMRKMLTLAKAKILPQGERYHKAEWLALLQHYEFKTTLLDWSEEFHSSLYFAIEPWGENSEKQPKKNACVLVLNPILYNLAKDMLEKERRVSLGKRAKAAYNQSVERLRSYLIDGRDIGEEYAIPLFTGGYSNEEYRCYFDLDIDREVSEDFLRLPVAAMTPSTNERMKRQAGVFTFCDVRVKPKFENGAWNYSANDISSIQQQYFSSAVQLGIPGCHIRPFLYNIILNCSNSKAFVQYLRAIGMRKYRMYPELTSLAKDIMAQSF